MLTLGFRLLVTGLIGLGVVGVGIAERLIRELRSLWLLLAARNCQANSVNH